MGTTPLVTTWQNTHCIPGRPAGKRSGENLKFLHVSHSIKASSGGVCLLKIMSAPTEPMVDAHASDASLWVRVGVKALRPRLEPSTRTAHEWVSASMGNVLERMHFSNIAHTCTHPPIRRARFEP